jgi:hypothetical protein
VFINERGGSIKGDAVSGCSELPAVRHAWHSQLQKSYFLCRELARPHGAARVRSNYWQLDRKHVVGRFCDAPLRVFVRGAIRLLPGSSTHKVRVTVLSHVCRYVCMYVCMCMASILFPSNVGHYRFHRKPSKWRSLAPKTVLHWEFMTRENWMRHLHRPDALRRTVHHGSSPPPPSIVQ